MSARIRQTAKSIPPRRPLEKAGGLAFRLLLLTGLAAVTLLAPRAAASQDAVRWSKVNIPAGGETGNWVLASGSDVRYLTAAADGTLYAYTPGLTYTLYKSTNAGLGWAPAGNVQDAIVAIAVSPRDAANVYYATAAAVYRSTNGGKTFAPLPAGPGGAGAGNKAITSLAVTWLNGDILAAGTRDTDSSEFGGLYTLDESVIIPTWADTGIGSYDVYAIAFSPGYAADRQLVAVMTDETDTFANVKIGDTAWGAHIGPARLNRSNAGTPISVAVGVSAAIAFPDSYNADVVSVDSAYYIAINTGVGRGDVYKIDGVEAPVASIATDLNIGLSLGQSDTDVTGLAVRGEGPAAILLAGASANSRTYVSRDGGHSWTRDRKEPTGAAGTAVLLPPDFTATGRMYAATTGAGSAVSISRDAGATWNQLSLIDTTIDTILDLAPSPQYGQDGTLFLLTFGGVHSLWRSRDGGTTWERTLAGNIAGVDSLKFVALPPQYGPDHRSVFVAGESSGVPTVWESTDDGQSYRRRFTRDPDTGSAFDIDAWAVTGDTALVIGSYDGSRARVYQTSNSGFFYTAGAAAGGQTLNSIALPPDYARDGTMLVGNSDGWVYRSDDSGRSFRPLPGDATASPLDGPVSVAFDPDFSRNRTVYAAGDVLNGSVYRFIIGTSAEWEAIDTTLPAGARLNRIAVASNGTLYAASTATDGGLERSLDPRFSPGPTFETFTRGLASGARLSGLWQNNLRVWSLDIANNRLMTFNDTLATPVTPVAPAEGASALGSLVDHTVRDVRLDWNTRDGATSYEWQSNYDTNFASVPAGLSGSTSSTTVRLPALDPATTYYWRVRASAPVTGPWSEKRSFTTSLDTEVIALQPQSPAAGATGVLLKPVFQWTAVLGADAYELLVGADIDFSRPAIIRTGEYALPANAWQSDVSLDYATTYYWKIRATGAGSRSPWSSTGVFTTESAPVPETDPPAAPKIPLPSSPAAKLPILTSATAPAPAPPLPVKLAPPGPPRNAAVPQAGHQSLSLPAWVIYLIGALLAAIILSLIVTLAIVLKIRRF